MTDERIEVEVAYARPDEQVILALKVPPGTKIEEAIRLSTVLDRFPEIDLAANKVGVFGKVGRLEQELVAGDRVEIYRLLIADPKEARKQRAAEGKAMKKGAAALSEDG